MSAMRSVATVAVGVVALAAAVAGTRLATRAAPPSLPSAPAPAAGVASRTKDIVAAPMTSPGKPLPPIEIDYSLVGVPSIGQPLEIRLRTGVATALPALNLALSGSERLQVPADVARLRLAFASAGERRTETIRVTPMAAGRHYLSVLAQAEIDGRLQARSVTIPIDVGGVSVESPQPAPTALDAAGERIVILPGRAN